MSKCSITALVKLWHFQARAIASVSFVFIVSYETFVAKTSNYNLAAHTSRFSLWLKPIVKILCVIWLAA